MISNHNKEGLLMLLDQLLRSIAGINKICDKISINKNEGRHESIEEGHLRCADRVSSAHRKATIMFDGRIGGGAA